MRIEITCKCGGALSIHDMDKNYSFNLDKMYRAVGEFEERHKPCIDAKQAFKAPATSLADLGIADNRAWLYRCHDLTHGSEFPENQRCLVCDTNDKEWFFPVKGDGETADGKYMFIHLKCFENGELEFNHSTRTLYWMHKGG